MKTLLLCCFALLVGLPHAVHADSHVAGGKQAATTVSSIIIYTPDMKSLARFYEQALQLPAPSTELDNHIGYWLGDNYLGFEPAAKTVRGPVGVSAWFAVADIQVAYARVLELGATKHMAPTPQPWGDIHAAVLDPDGNVLGLIEVAESR